MNERKTSSGKRSQPDLKSRLFQKGFNSANIGPLKSPLASEGSNNTLLINLASSNQNKNSPKILRKQISCLSNSPSSLVNMRSTAKDYMKRDHIKTQKEQSFEGLFSKSYDNNHSRIDKKPKQVKDFYKTTKSNFFRSTKKTKQNFYPSFNTQELNQLKLQRDKSLSAEKSSDKSQGILDSPKKSDIHSNSNTQEFIRTKALMEKLSGKSTSAEIKKRPQNLIIADKNCEAIESKTLSPQLQNGEKSVPIQKKSHTLESYISLVQKKQKNLEQFLYLVNRKYINMMLNNGKFILNQVGEIVPNKLPSNSHHLNSPKSPQTNKNKPQEVMANHIECLDLDNPYDLQILPQSMTPSSTTLNSALNKNLEGNNSPITIPKYYTISKKGLCHYHNNKPIEFIEIEEWLAEKKNYEKIKQLAFFNKFKRWKIVRMWRKIVLKQRIEECSKNLEQNMFWMNNIMRECLFDTRKISLDLGKNMVIINSNTGNKDYTLDHFKIVQEKSKRQVAGVIQDYSRLSRQVINNCFEEVLKNQRTAVKQREQNEDKLSSITSQINAKDAAFQALGFPSKMSYENRSRLRKMAGNFIRFSYLIDMIQSAGLAYYFQAQLTSFINSVKQASVLQPAQIIVTKEVPQKGGEKIDQQIKMFTINLILKSQNISQNDHQNQIQDWHSQQFINNTLLHQLCPSAYPIQDQQQQQIILHRNQICDYYLRLTPDFDEINDELNIHIKQSLSSLKYFQRWAKHRDMERYVNILEEWDDVVTESRQIADNENLDPVPILNTFDQSLITIKAIMMDSMTLSKKKIHQQMAQYLSIYTEIGKIDLEVFRSESLDSPAETVETFLNYLTTSLQKFQTKIPYQIRYGIFEINLHYVKNQLVERLTEISEEFKRILPQIVQERTKYLNDWLIKYNQVIREQIKNIDDFVVKVKYVKQIEQTLEIKKELCSNLSSIYQTMEAHKFNTKKRKDFETVTLKLKDQLQQQLNIFDQTCERQSEVYVRQITRNYFPTIIKDIKKISVLLQNPKYSTKDPLAKGSPIQQLKLLQNRYEEIQQRNKRFCEYQLILNSFIAEGTSNAMGKSQKNLRSSKNICQISSSPKNIEFDHRESSIYTEHLYPIKTLLRNLITIWQKCQQWDGILKSLENKEIQQILQEEYKQNLKIKVRHSRQILNLLDNKLEINSEKDLSVELIDQFERKVCVLESYLPIIVGFKQPLAQSHWDQIIELANRQGPHNLDLRKYEKILFKQLTNSGIGDSKDEFTAIFYRAKNQIALQNQYTQLQNKWENMIVKIKNQGKYHFIASDEEQIQIIEMFDNGLRVITKILSNPFSNKLKLTNLTYQSLLYGLQTFRKYIEIQRKYVKLEKVTKFLDLKKLPEPSILEQFDKHQKNLQKLMQSRNVENGFKLMRLVQPPNSVTFRQKFEQSLQYLEVLSNGIQSIVKDYRKNIINNNPGVLLRLSNEDILKVITLPGSATPQIIQWACSKVLDEIVGNIVITGERITNLISYDGQSLLKTPISIGSELEQIMEQIVDSITDVTRKTMRNCRVKSLESPSLLSYDIIKQFNLQYLLAINKVDFSNYAAISIQNRGQNCSAVKQYLRILRKDTASGVTKLKQKIYSCNSEDQEYKKTFKKHVLNYEGLLLQNFVHQQILNELVKANVSCANDFAWINQLRFSWQDNGMNLDQTNIIAKKIHVSIRYGKQYIGSRVKVLTNTDTDMLLAIKFSQKIFYDGAYQQMKIFVDAIAHKIKIISCTSEFKTKQLKDLLNAYNSTDCLFFMKNPNQLKPEVFWQILNDNLLNTLSARTQSSSLNIQSSRHTTTIITNPLPVASQNYNPIFIQLKKWTHCQMNAYKSQYRTVGFCKIQTQYIDAYLKLYTWNNDSSLSAQDLESSVSNGKNCNESKESENSHHFGSILNKKNYLGLTATAFIHTIKNDGESKISNFILQIITQASEFLGNSELCVQNFLYSLKQDLMNIQTPRFTGDQSEKEKLSSEYTKSAIHKILQKLLEYLRDKLSHKSYSIFHEQIKKSYEGCFPEGKKIILSDRKNQSKPTKIKIITGNKQLLLEQIRQKKLENAQCQYINIHEHTLEELFGTPSAFGILDQAIFTNGLLDEAVGALMYKQLVRNKKDIALYTNIKNKSIDFQSKSAFIKALSDVNGKLMKKRSSNLINNKVKFDTDETDGIKSNKTQSKIFIWGISEQLINYMLELTADYFQNDQAFSPPEIIIYCEKISDYIDPRILVEFQYRQVTLTQDHINQLVDKWIQKHIFNGGSQKWKLEDKQIIGSNISKFYVKTLKSLWRSIYSKAENIDQIQQLAQKMIIIERILKTLSIHFPTLPSTPTLYKSLPPANSTSPSRPSPLVQLLCYSLLQAYSLSNPCSATYLKIETYMKKILGDNDNIKDGLNLLNQYLFDGKNMISILEHYKKNTNEENKFLERGKYYISPQFMHYHLLIDNVFKNTNYGIKVQGEAWSGKTSFVQSYRLKKYDQTAYIKLNMHYIKNKQHLYNRLSSVLCLNDITTIKSKLYYGSTTIIIEDLEMPIKQSNLAVCQMLETMTKLKEIRLPRICQKYKLENVNFIITSNLNKQQKEEQFSFQKFDDCMVPILLGVGPQQQKLKIIFTQVSKANLMDSMVPDHIIHDALDLTFKIFQQLKIKTNNNTLLDISLVKRMSMFISHLRFKNNSSSNTQVQRFWGSMIKQQFQSYCVNYNFDFKKLKSLTNFSKSQTVRNIIEHIKSQTPLLYSHLHIKQQKYGIGKQVEIIKDLARMQNLVNQKINKYNEMDDESKRYGLTFQFISIKQIIIKIIKMSNQILGSDYAIIGWSNQANAIIRLTSFLMGFSFKEKKKDLTLIDTVKGIIPQVTQLSSYLISMKVTKQNINQFIQYYDSDFSAEILNHKPQNKQNTGMKQSAQFRPSEMEQSLNNNTIIPTCQPTLKDLNNIDRSIRLTYQFTEQNILKSSQNFPNNDSNGKQGIPGYIKARISFDFCSQYPKQSIIRLTKQILQINTTQFCQNSTEILYSIYQSLRNGFQINTNDCKNQQSNSQKRIKLNISLKQYEQCVRLYSSFINFLPGQLKPCLNKFKTIVSLYQKLSSIIKRLEVQIQTTWQQKKKINIQIKTEKQTSSNLEELQSELIEITQNLQYKTQLKSQCQKILSFLHPSINQYKQKYHKLSKFCSQQKYFKQTISIIASYITYLSKFPFYIRKKYLYQWYKSIPVLSQIQQKQRIYSISQIFYLTGQDQSLFLQDAYRNNQICSYIEQQQLYENMIIILESIKPTLIYDSNGRAKKWLKNQNKSFVSVCQNQQNFYSDLIKYLQEGNDILLELKSQETLSSIPTNYIASLIYMPEGNSTVQINGFEIQVNKQTKVYIVINDTNRLTLPQQISSQFLKLTYQPCKQSHLKTIKQQLTMNKNVQKYSTYKQLQTKIKQLTNKIIKNQSGIAEEVWKQFYLDHQNQNNQQKQYNQSIQEIEEKFEDKQSELFSEKNQEQVIKLVKQFKKSLSNQIQDHIQKINSKKKLLPEMQQKLAGMNPNTNQIQQLYNAVQILYETLNILSLLDHHNLGQFYGIIKLAIQQGYFKNMGMFILFALKQWGQRCNQQQFIVFAFILIARIQGSTINQVKQLIKYLSVDSITKLNNDINDETILQTPYTANRLLNKLLQQIQHNSNNNNDNNFTYSLHNIQELIINSIIKYLDEIQYEFLTGICLMRKSPIDKALLSLKNDSNNNKSNKNVEDDKQQQNKQVIIDINKILNHLVIFTGQTEKLQQIYNNTNNQDSNNTNIAFNLTGNLCLNSSKLTLYNGNFYLKKQAQQIQNIPCSQIKTSQGIQYDLKKILNDKKNLYIGSNYLNNLKVRNNYLNVNQQYQLNQHQMLLQQYERYDGRILKLVFQEIIKYYDYEDNIEEMKNNQEKSKSKQNGSNLKQSKARMSKNTRTSKIQKNSDLNGKGNGVTFGQSIQHYIYNGSRVQLSQNFKVFIYCRDLHQIRQILQTIFDKNSNPLSHVEVRDVSGGAQNLLLTLYKKMQKKNSDDRYCQEIKKQTEPYRRGQKKKYTINQCLPPSSKVIDNRTNIPTTSKKLPFPLAATSNINIQSSRNLIPSSKRQLHQSLTSYHGQDHLITITKILYEHLQKHIQAQIGQNNVCSKNLVQNIQKIRQNISDDNSSWEPDQQINVLLQIIIQYIQHPNQRVVRSKASLQNYVKLIKNLRIRINKILVLGGNIQEEEIIFPSDKSARIFLKIIELISIIILEDENKNLKYLKQHQNYQKKQVEFTNLRNNWIQLFRKYLKMPSIYGYENKGKNLLSIFDNLQNRKQTDRSQIQKYSGLNQILTKNVKKVSKQLPKQKIPESKNVIHNKTRKQLNTKLPTQLLKLKRQIQQTRINLLKEDSRYVEKVSKMRKVSKYLLNSAPYLLAMQTIIQLQDNQIPKHWRMILYRSTQPISEMSESTLITSKKQLKRSQNLHKNLLKNKTQLNKLSEQIRILSLYNVDTEDSLYKGEQLDMQNIKEPINIIRTCFNRQEFRGPFIQYKSITNNALNVDRKMQQNINVNKQIYVLTPTITTEQFESMNFIRIKDLYAQGWKLGNQGTIQIIQEQKTSGVNIATSNRNSLLNLRGMFIIKRKRIPQITLCELILREYPYPQKNCRIKQTDIHIHCYKLKNPGMKIYAYTKKLAPGWKGELYLKK